MELLPKRFEKNWEIYGVLLFLGFFFFYFPALTLIQQLFCIVGVAFFSVLYFYAHWHSGIRVALALSGIAAIGFILSPINPGASVFFTYAVAVAGLLLPFRVAAVAAIVILGVFAMQSTALERTTAYIVGHSFLIMVVAVIYIQVRRGDLINERLHRREEEIETQSIHQERERIARDLHDLLGQSFSLIGLKAELSRRLLHTDPERAGQELGDLADTARSSLGQVRASIDGYYVSALDNELKEADRLLHAAGIEFVLNQDASEFPSATNTLLALIIRESVTNVVRHSQARNCEISISRDGNQTQMTIRDDGVGVRRQDGKGLRGMKERARRIGAHLAISGTNGTCIQLTFKET